MVTAKCIKNIDPWGNVLMNLTVGKVYTVKWISMGPSYTSVYLENKTRGYNSILFEFFEDGKPLDIYSDKRFNPYIK